MIRRYTMKKYAIGLDYGTLSVRALLVDIADGTEIAQSVYEYPHACMETHIPTGEPLPPAWSLQDPSDYLEGLITVVRGVMKESKALPEDEVVRLKWKELAGQYTSKPRLASMLSSGQINLSEDAGVKVVEFVVMNEAQKQWVEEKMQRELENKLRDLLSCRKVNIVVAVTPEPENAEKVPYMPEEKAKDLMEKNPAVREFVAEMGLDTK